jgi:hypothetical protein
MLCARLTELSLSGHTGAENYRKRLLMALPDPEINDETADFSP